MSLMTPVRGDAVNGAMKTRAVQPEQSAFGCIRAIPLRPPDPRKRSAARPSRGGAVLACAVLLTGLFAANSASAQTVIWEATLTPEEFMLGTVTWIGFAVDKGGTLSDDDFVYGGVTYKFDTIARRDSDSKFGLQTLVGCCPGALPDASSTWILESAGTQIAIKDLTASAFPGLYSASNAPNFQDGQAVTVRIFSPGVPPSAVRNLTARAGNQQVHVEWDRPETIGEPGVYLFYYEYQRKDGSGPWSEWIESPAQTQQTTGFTLTGLDNGTVYSFRVRLINTQRFAGPDGDTVTATPVATYRLNHTRWGIRRGDEGTPVTLSVGGGPFRGRQTYTLHWNGNPVNQAPLHADNPTTMVLPAGQNQVTVQLRAAADADGADKVYNAEVQYPLVARQGGSEVVRTRQSRLYDGNLSVHDNESEPVVSLEAPELVEEGEPFRLTVRFSHRLDRDADIGVGFSNPSRAKWNLTDPVNVLPSPFVITIPEGDLSSRATIVKPDNSDKDGDTEITFVLSQPARDDPWKLGNSAKTVRINDDETPDSDYRRGPWLRIGPASGRESGDGSDTSMRFRVNLDDRRSTQTTVSVDYRTVDKTARAGSDYLAASGTLTFAPGEKSKEFDVTIKDDQVEDTGETFEVRLENPTGGGRIHPYKGKTTGTIANTEIAVLSASFPSSRFMSSSHTGADDQPQVIVEFSEAVAAIDKSTPSVTVTGGAIASVQAHTEDGLEHAYIFWVTPEGEEDVTFTLVPNAACSAGGICTAAGTPLTEVPRARTIPGPGDSSGTTRSELSVNDTKASEEDDATIDFVVKLDPASTETVTVDYATSNGSASAGDDYTAKSGTLTFSPGETSKTVAVPILDDTIEENDETLTLTLSNAPGAEIKDTTATGTINDDEADPATPDALTASFKNMPADHDGSSEFTFQVEFSEDVGLSYAVLRDDGFTETNGDVTGARRVNGRNDLWQITVKPDERDDVTITLPGNRDCGTTGAVCTRGDDPRPLSNSPSATVAGPAVDPAVTNTAATGAPTISGTEQVGETLTASVSGISDADGLDDANFAYQWIRGSADIEGATGSIYALVSADEGETITVRVSFTDDAENAESLTSAATDAVAAAPKPLTASFSGMPAEHAGEGTFSFGLTFSENVELSYLTLRDAALSASGGAVRKAQRQQQGSNVGWDITVEPDSAGAVTIGLPGTTDCDAGGAICTADGRPLSHSLSATIAGPVGISVADARVEEAEGAQLAFVVTLSRAASGALTVDYATSDGSAQAGVDYTAASGTLTFRAGESSRTIEVAVLDDSHDDGGETLTLTLSNPSSGRLTDAGATGTIVNRDPLPRALLARFGRTAAVHVVEHVEERLQAPRDPGFRGWFAGRELRRGMERDFALGFLRQLGGAAGVNGPGAGTYGAMAGAPADGGASLGTPGRGASGGMATATGPMGGAAGPDGGLNGGGLLQMGFGGGGLLTGSAVAVNRETHGGILSFWSRGAQSNFSGREGALSLGGDVRTTMIGADYAKGPLVTGLSLSHSRGLGEYAGVTGGQVASAVTGLYPWLGYQATDRITVWGVAGYGAGGLLLTPEGGSALESGLSMAMAAAGTRGALVAGGAGGFALAFKADALWVGTSIDGVDGAAGRLAATEAAVTRFRTGLEGSRDYTLAGRLSLRPSVEVGLRHDGGDAENGAGLDVGGGLVVSDASTGLAVDLRVRMLVMHQAEGFRERGMALSLSYNPTPSTPLGFTARVAPSWGGQATSGAKALWGQETMAGMARGGVADGTRLDAEVGYGLPVGSRFVGTPRVGVGTSADGRDYRLGYSLGARGGEGTAVELGVDAQRRERSLQGSTDHGAIARATVHW